MARSIRISWKTAQQIVRALDAAEAAMNHMGDALNKMDAVDESDEKHFPAFGAVGAAAVLLRSAMTPKCSVVAHRKEKAPKKKSKRERTSEIYEAVAARANGRCEACGKTFGSFNAATMDHFFGKKHVREAPSNCWMLGWVCCHRAKTDNNPSRSHWQATFMQHASTHGYAKEVQEIEREWDSQNDLIRAAALSKESEAGHG